MHPIQARLLQLIENQNIGSLSLREIAELVGERLPQKIKHHLAQLESKGFIRIDVHLGIVSRITDGEDAESVLVSIPILGSANCGPATLYANQNIAGYLKISRRFLSKKTGLFAIRAQGNSLNRANVNGKTVDSGDYVIIDSTQQCGDDGDYVLAVIDGLANIKKYCLDKAHTRIVLISESSQQHNPIFIHEEDHFVISGKVIDVIKKF